MPHVPDDTALHILRQRPSRSAREIIADCLDRHTPPVRSLYIHVPFCEHKCHYCDFYSFVDSRDRQQIFIERLLVECRALACLTRGEPLRTVFVGGGTPTLLTDDRWDMLLAGLHGAYTIGPETEFTVECNPETARPGLFERLAAGGVNRLSIGAQSFEPKHLKTLERLHDPAKVASAVELAHAAGIGRCSIDLIYAIPGQTMADMDHDLDRALELPVEHIAAYNLTYEPNTAMTRRLQRNEFMPVPDETEAAMFERIAERMNAAGFDRYEVSNYARHAASCRHNLAYWRQEQWLGAGPSASAHVGGHRYKVVPRLDDYLSFESKGFPLIVDHEEPDARRAVAEIIMTGLRLGEGLDVAKVNAALEQIDPGLTTTIAEEASACADRGWLDERGGRWTLTPPGQLYADGIAADMISLILH